MQYLYCRRIGNYFLHDEQTKVHSPLPVITYLAPGRLMSITPVHHLYLFLHLAITGHSDWTLTYLEYTGTGQDREANDREWLDYHHFVPQPDTVITSVRMVFNHKVR
jgi:hypothetical protein